MQSSVFMQSAELQEVYELGREIVIVEKGIEMVSPTNKRGGALRLTCNFILFFILIILFFGFSR